MLPRLSGGRAAFPSWEITRRCIVGKPFRMSADEWQTARVELAIRSRGRCECCGVPLRGRAQAHHRKLKSRGGGDEMENLLYVLPEHHALIHANPAWAAAHGYMVSSMWDPAEVPVLTCRSSLSLCEHEG
jgi:hypothetical protein